MTDTQKERQQQNARRLKAILNRYAADPYAVKQIAHYLNYWPEQLAEDMTDLAAYVDRLEAEAAE